MSGHFLIVEARFYNDISEAQLSGAKAVLQAARASFDHVSVPGALEIPIAIAMAAATQQHYDGYVAIGCVIRGQTSHYETVCAESARGLMDLALAENLAIGNGILTVENESQAWERADPLKLDKGGDAARASLALASLRRRFDIQSDEQK